MNQFRYHPWVFFALLGSVIGQGLTVPTWGAPKNPCVSPEICVQQELDFVGRYAWEPLQQSKIHIAFQSLELKGFKLIHRGASDVRNMAYRFEVEETVSIQKGMGKESILSIVRKIRLLDYAITLDGITQSALHPGDTQQAAFRIGKDLIPQEVSKDPAKVSAQAPIPTRSHTYIGKTSKNEFLITDDDALNYSKGLRYEFLKAAPETAFVVWSDLGHTRLILATDAGARLVVFERAKAAEDPLSPNTDFLFSKIEEMQRALLKLCPNPPPRPGAKRAARPSTQPGGPLPMMECEEFDITYGPLLESLDNIVAIKERKGSVDLSGNRLIGQEWSFFFFHLHNVSLEEIQKDESLTEVGPVVKSFVDNANLVNAKLFQRRPGDPPTGQIASRLAASLQSGISSILVTSGIVSTESDEEKREIRIVTTAREFYREPDRDSARKALLHLKRHALEINTAHNQRDASAQIGRELDAMVETYNSGLSQFGQDLLDMGATEPQLRGVHNIVKTLMRLRQGNAKSRREAVVP